MKIKYPEKFIHPGAIVEGRVDLGMGSSVWGGSVLRADMNYIKIGQAVNIQDNSTLHTDSHNTIEIGDFSLIGHNVMIHGAKIGKACLIGIACVILDEAEIGDGAMVTAGCMIRGGMKIPPKALVVQKNGKLKVYENKARYLRTIAGSIEYMQLIQKHREKSWTGFTTEEENVFLEEAKSIAKELGLEA